MAGTSLEHIHCQVVKTLTLGKWTPLHHCLDLIFIRIGGLFDGELLQKTDTLDKEEEQLRKAHSFWGKEKFLLPEPLREVLKSPAQSAMVTSQLQADSSRGRGSLTIDDFPDIHQNDLAGSLQLGSFPVAERLSLFLDAWKSITHDQWVLPIISEGYGLVICLPLSVTKKPVETHLPGARITVERSTVPLRQRSHRGASTR